MVKGMEHIHRIHELMKEMNVQLEQLRASEKEHRKEYPIVQNQLIDFEHIPENVSLSGSESAKFIRDYREALLKRNHLKDFFAVVNTIGKDLAFLDSTVQSILPRLTHYGVRSESDFYRFRTDEMFDFASTFKSVEKRAEKEMVRMKENKTETLSSETDGLEEHPSRVVSESMVEMLQEALPSSSEHEIETPLSVTQKKVVHPCRITNAGKLWQVYRDGEALISTKSMDELVQYLVDENVEHMKIQQAEKKRLLTFISRVKMKTKGKTLHFVDGLKELEHRIQGNA